jgi:hypothetical protein
MKTLRVLGIAAVVSWACLFSIVRADTVNLIDNGEFSANLDGWNDWNDGVTRLDTATSTSPNGPSISYGNNAWFSYNPTTALEAGKTYEFSLYGKLLASTASSTEYDKTLYSKVALGATTYVELTPTFGDTWQKYSVQFTPTQNVSGYEVALLNSIVNNDNHGGGASPCTFGIDSVSLSAVQTPEPSTVALLGTGVFGLLAYAWRKRK